ncbi:DUF1056 family protein [Lactococcus sp. NH2-7C]|uniref:DUF1056 family protein n=2 Tax=Lactococcus sp. NH2-7C TaxID=2879149 RepID=UPI00248CCF83|nr:DUF1056 family protein [Lactococcus sp. NH2-7C]WGV31349.1 DUF1056 family protein [Lactococcus sp. NH2-7C]
MMIGDLMKIFKTFFKKIWDVFDVLCFSLAAITLNITVFLMNLFAGGITLTVTFIVFGVGSWFISSKITKGGD